MTDLSTPKPPIGLPTSFYMDTSAGGIPITLCACGLLIFQPMARIHLATCATYIAHQADAPTDGDT